MAAPLTGHVALVTGAAQGIGAAIVRRLHDAGAAVLAVDVRHAVEATVAALPGPAPAAAAVLDVCDRAAVRVAVARCAQELGPVSVLVNNAGIAVFEDPLTLTPETWRRCFDVDLDAVWWCTQACLPAMLERGTGRIVNIASVHAERIIPGSFPYPVAKHGVLGLTRALAGEYAARGVRVNAVSPGYVDTEIVERHFASLPDPSAERRRIAALHPLGRLGRPEEIAAAALFLASDESSFITGQNLVADGGRSIIYHDRAA